MAATAPTAGPPLVVFLLGQRLFLKGLSEGAVKGYRAIDGR
jgi:ABC-type glycerol-3-phosphate transport system permease component